MVGIASFLSSFPSSDWALELIFPHRSFPIFSLEKGCNARSLSGIAISGRLVLRYQWSPWRSRNPMQIWWGIWKAQIWSPIFWCCAPSCRGYSLSNTVPAFGIESVGKVLKHCGGARHTVGAFRFCFDNFSGWKKHIHPCCGWFQLFCGFRLGRPIRRQVGWCLNA